MRGLDVDGKVASLSEQLADCLARALMEHEDGYAILLAPAHPPSSFAPVSSTF